MPFSVRPLWIAAAVLAVAAIGAGILLELRGVSERRQHAVLASIGIGERVGPELGQVNLLRPPSGARGETIASELAAAALADGGHAAAVWNKSGTVAISGVSTDVGQRVPDPGVLERVLGGSHERTLVGNDLRVAVPLRAAPGKPPYAALVISFDDASFREQAADPWRTVAYAGGGLLALAIVLTPKALASAPSAGRRRDRRRRSQGPPPPRTPAATIGRSADPSPTTPSGAPQAPPSPHAAPPGPTASGPTAPPPTPAALGIPPSTRELEEARDRAWKADERAALAERQAAAAQEALQQAREELRRATDEAHRLRQRLEQAGIPEEGSGPVTGLEAELRALQDEAVTLRTRLARTQSQLTESERLREEADHRLREVLAAQASPDASPAASPADASPAADDDAPPPPAPEGVPEPPPGLEAVPAEPSPNGSAEPSPEAPDERDEEAEAAEAGGDDVALTEEERRALRERFVRRRSRDELRRRQSGYLDPAPWDQVS